MTVRTFLIFGTLFFFFSSFFSARDVCAAESNPYEERMKLYKKVETVTHIPWYYLAAIDQYERNVRMVRRDLPKPNRVISIYFPPEVWVGLTNPNLEEEDPAIIKFFQGMGVDGDGDGKASLKSDEDVLYAFANYLLSYGVDHDNIKIGLWNYYHRDRTVGSIASYAKIYRHFGRIDLDTNVFPVPLSSNHSYRSTWGDARGWGGRRIHEGTDIFADYGVPVRATSYGIVEIKGWNKYGGWRIGIRDINNNYHYYAHLSGFAKGIEKGKIVEPGMVIGGVGSSGYGPPGTSGKFPPHLHYGMYKDNGKTEWSFDPYPHLVKWKRMERASLKKK
ncbi:MULTISPECIES: M23 family metallopeptidase [Neobacillus]|jgi:peptidoglycan LD-endopeptidase LytH|uniref:M23 family metallopeptidase n=1 Tax=Neobacillus sedimentimangrovi TaxID=2699460 RepID=A0ABS8QLJ7_9BACI|nr:M23 family metallopeptidase [Neobacillus sedimentimangrovi]AIM16078.1 peptidase M23 [Bacillus sp. X1(2014)]MCD4840033.1 M23 family metallopeptidase [Neobacillus sedimentimangrovi]